MNGVFSLFTHVSKSPFISIYTQRFTHIHSYIMSHTHKTNTHTHTHTYMYKKRKHSFSHSDFYQELIDT